MALFSIEFKSKALKDLKAVPLKNIRKIYNRINQLQDNPFPLGFKKLKGSESYYRIRMGDYRIIYSVERMK